MADASEKRFEAEIQIPTARKYAVIKIKVPNGSVQEVVEAYYALNEAYWAESNRRKLLEAKPIKKTK